MSNNGQPYHSSIYRLAIIPLLLLSFLTNQATAQQAQRYYRFQWHKYNWRVIHKKDFHVYFTEGADSLGAYITHKTPDVLDALKKSMQKDASKPPNIIIYPSTDQQYESNIGSYDLQQYTLPTFVAKGNRVVLAYNGSYADLEQQLKEALARSIWEDQLNNGLADQAQGISSTTTQTTKATPKSEPIPTWFQEGAIRYFANGWPIKQEDQLRLSFEKNSFTSWQQVLNYEPRLGGQAFCYYLTERYQKQAIAQIFFQLKKKPSLQRVARIITKHTLDTLYSQCFAYYNKRFQPNKEQAITIQKQTTTIPHKKGIIGNIIINSQRDYIAYTTTSYNKRTVYIYDTKSKTTNKISIYVLPPWIDDHSRDMYPILQWHSNDHDIYVVQPIKGKITIKRYSTTGVLQETTKLYGVDGITSLQPLSDREFLLTAYRKGQSDIVGYNDNKERYTPYTSDTYDDGSPILDKKTSDLYFISDRPNERKEKVFQIGVGYKKDTLWQGIYKIKGKELAPIAIDTIPYKQWDKLDQINDNRLLATNTATGIERFEVLNYFNTTKKTQLNQYEPYQYDPISQQITFNRIDKDSIYLTTENIDDWISTNRTTDTSSTWLNDYYKRLAEQAREDSILKRAKDTTHSILEDIFKPKQKDDKADKKKKHGINGKDSTGMLQMQHPDKSEPYVLQLQSAYFTAQVNNDYFMNRYQPYLNNQGVFQFPQLGAMAQGGFTDLLENHHFTIAYRIPSATEGSTFFARYENTARKVDWGVSYFRDVTTLQPPDTTWVDENGNPYPKNAKVKTHYYEVFLTDPLTYDCSIGIDEGIRKDRTVFLATDKYSLDFAPIQSLWSTTTFSFKLNKEQPTIPYLFKGFKMDAYVDVFKGFTQQEAALFGSTINMSYSLPVYKYITLVTQLHAGYSQGDEKVLYNLGGEDNNVTPRVDTAVHFSQSAPYAFQTLVTPFRGYYQNSLYGNQYTLFNADLYFPIFKTLIPIQTPLPSINNLQLGIFSDAATAKETWNTGIPNNSKWLMAYGLSARTTLAGYPLRVDIAWPGSLNKQPVVYFTLNLQ